MPDNPRFSVVTDFPYRKTRPCPEVRRITVDLDAILARQGTPAEWNTEKWKILKLFPYSKNLQELDCFKGEAGEVSGETLIGELLDNYLTDYQTRCPKNAPKIKSHIVPVRGFFGELPAKDLTLKLVEAFKRDRMNSPLRGWAAKTGKGAARATVNQNLQVLNGAFKLAKLPILFQLPFENLANHPNARKGFFEEKEFEAFLRYLPEWMGNLVKTEYRTGWRISELLSRKTHEHLDLEKCTLRLEPGETKNNEGRTFPFAKYQKLRDVLRDQVSATEKWRAATRHFAPVVWLFHRDGQPIKYSTFHKFWVIARTKVNEERVVAGLPPYEQNKLSHDFRRTAARDMLAAGIDERVVMKLVGWKTFAMLQRYAIVDLQTLEAATAQLGQMERMAAKIAHDSPTNGGLPVENPL
jgi:integrase